MTKRFMHLTRRSGLLGGAGLVLAGFPVAAAESHRRDDHDDNGAVANGSGGMEILPPFGTGWGLMDPVERAGAKPAIYGGTDADPTWLISQWGISGQRLPPFRQRAAQEVWVTHGPTAGVLVSPRQVRLEQHGGELACDVGRPGHAQAREFDLFLSPARMLHQSITAPRRITLSVAFEATVRSSRREHDCKVTQGATLVAFVLGNTTAKQTLFHQIHFQVEREAHEEGHAREMREERPRRMSWFWKKNPFGVDEYVGNDGPAVHRSFDILPLIHRAIASAPAELDRNLEHWTFNSTYAGQHIWGGTTITSTWRKYSLVVA